MNDNLQCKKWKRGIEFNVQLEMFIATSQVTFPQSNRPALPHASDVKLHSHS